MTTQVPIVWWRYLYYQSWWTMADFHPDAPWVSQRNSVWLARQAATRTRRKFPLATQGRDVAHAGWGHIYCRQRGLPKNFRLSPIIDQGYSTDFIRYRIMTPPNSRCLCTVRWFWPYWFLKCWYSLSICSSQCRKVWLPGIRRGNWTGESCSSISTIFWRRNQAW